MREDGESKILKARRTEGVFTLDMSLQFKKMKFESLVKILPVPEYLQNEHQQCSPIFVEDYLKVPKGEILVIYTERSHLGR
jgi:hypothetical protein